jgi:hypothetical protein
MPTLRDGWGHRVFWSGLAALLCAGPLLTSTGSLHLLQWVSAAGWALLSVAWLLQPPVLSLGFASSARSAASLTVGPPAVRVWLGGFGLALVVLAFVARAVSAA